tara:strand:+ start:585 stop:1214 length:630 start_codon:yes stop_codon:yes gene_type:complete
MIKFQNQNNIEVGVDECARGVLFGRIYGAAVIYPKDGIPKEIEEMINDSKKLSSKKRARIYDELKKTDLKYAYSFCESKDVDEKGIQFCNYKVFHDSIDKLKVKPDKILVDGRCFKPYFYKNECIDHECIIKGDSKYYSIACASIIAKEEHDRYIIELLNEHSDLRKYDLEKNMGYGTKNHIIAISNYGYSKFHRFSYRIKNLNNFKKK